MKITIDGTEIEVIESDKNIIDVADRAKVAIPCACYRAKDKAGCCRACVVDVDGKHEFACATKPAADMNVVVAREDLEELRKQRLVEYRDNIEKGTQSDCCCSG